MVMTPPNEVLIVGSTTTLIIRNPQPSDNGVYQCVFNDSVNEWTLRRNLSGNWYIRITINSYACSKLYW